MPLFPDTPKTLLDELALDKEMDEARWRLFDEMYRPVVAAFIVQRFPAVAHEAEDVAQETMIRLAAAVRERRYEAVRGKFRTFLGAIASNLVVDILRRHARYANLPLDTVDWVSPQPADAPALALLDLRGLDPSTIRGYFYSFVGFTALASILADSTWSLASGASGMSTFYNCTSIVGGNGTA